MTQTSSAASPAETGEERSRRLRKLAINQQWAQENADDLREQLERELAPLMAEIKASCGHGGWSIIRVNGEQATVELVHDCFVQHHYDLHCYYNYTFDLELEAAL